MWLKVFCGWSSKAGNISYRVNLRTRIRFCLAFAALWALSVHSAGYGELEFESEAALLEQLKGAKGADRVGVLTALARNAIERDPIETAGLLDEAEQLSGKTDYVARSYIAGLRCFLMIQLGRPEEAEQNCQRGLRLAQQTDDLRAQSSAYSSVGVHAYRRGDISEAHKQLSQAVALAERTTDKLQLARVLSNLGLIVRTQGLQQESLQYFSMGLNLVQPTDDIYQVMQFNVAINHLDLEQFDLARDHFLRARRWAAERKNYRKVLITRIYEAKLDIAVGNPEKAIENLSAAVKDRVYQFDRGHLGFAYAILGEACLAVGRVDGALVAFATGMPLSNRGTNAMEWRLLSLGHAKALRMKGEHARAVQELHALIVELEASEHGEALIGAYSELSLNFEELGDFKQSLSYLRKATLAGHQLRTDSLEGKLSILRAEFELDQKTQELALARQKEYASAMRADRDQLTIYALIAFALGVIIIMYLSLTRRSANLRAQVERKSNAQLESLVTKRTLELEKQMKERSAADEARLAMEQRMAEADKLRVLGQLTGGVAHDFNNLLTVITGAAELLRMQAEENDDQNTELVDHILAAADSGADITRALTAYARQQPFRKKRVKLNDFVVIIAKLVRRSLGAGNEVIFQDHSCEDLYAELDSGQLTTAVLNLAINARDSMKNNGSILIELYQQGRAACIRVVDTGCGMNEEEIDHACEPFFSTKDVNEGGGLGLSMVYGFAKQSGGDLVIESKPKQGTSVTLKLPIADYQAELKVGEAS